ncbi:NtaA/DmoA family FMN-dependent monooxygenase [Paenibacillus sp. 5J-6]|uniref:NtaA/DmoA family FMN-dependent monooxygenase n=1 Tax=Paenibacillus silvestris TaxID=2606219 RepID=A0A6L8V4T1_9BACL|nr:LLM class flavin-dependent oxidoreductase [Paenibacillus silvestris]MZQ85287.1 NtaA/DmoA family FMN-dependent monooxygenase [Paenibacillus silvestris]
MSEKERKIHLNVFVRISGHHAGGWKHPEAEPQRDLDIDKYVELAQLAEKGLIDSLFTADNYSGTGRRLEPFTLLSALAAVTTNIGLIGTVSTTYNDPFHVARKFASLDYLSKGRAGWNIVTGHSPEDGDNITRWGGYPEPSKRYEIGDEFVEVTKQLWDSWDEEGAESIDERHLKINHTHIHEIDFKGNYFHVKGPLNIPRPPQGYPVLVQAGSSKEGKELAAKHAEVIFTAQQTLGAAQEFYSDVKSRLAKYGRNPNDLLIMPGLGAIVGETEAEAKDLEDELFSLLNLESSLKQASRFFSVDLSEYSLDDLVPLDKVKSDEQNLGGITSRREVVLDAVRRENMTIRQFLNRSAGGHGHVTYRGSYLQVADFIETWLRERGADGFNLLPQVVPHSLEVFINKVIPELQNRGIFRTAYEGATLRENLGLARPENHNRKIWTANYQAIKVNAAESAN